MSVHRAAQVALAARLLTTAGVTALVASTGDGPAVFARGQGGYDDLYPRITLDPPQFVPEPGLCGRGGELLVTLHSWARGDDCSLIAGDVAEAAVAALATPLILDGWRVSTWSHEDSRPVGDPSPAVEHVVIRFRYSVQQTG